MEAEELLHAAGVMAQHDQMMIPDRLAQQRVQSLRQRNPNLRAAQVFFVQIFDNFPILDKVTIHQRGTLEDRRIAFTQMASQRDAQIGFKMRHQPESARHGQRQCAVREDDLFLLGENPRRIAHEDRLIRQLADQISVIAINDGISPSQPP